MLQAVASASAPLTGRAAQIGAVSVRPDIVIVISDQFRWHCVGAMGLNPMNLIPNIAPPLNVPRNFTLFAVAQVHRDFLS